MWIRRSLPERTQLSNVSEAGININDVARHFCIHKTIAYRTTNRLWQTRLAGDHLKSDRPKKTNSIGGTFH